MRLVPDERVLHLYPSALARDAALDERCAAQSGGAVWADEQLTFAQFFALLDRRLPPDGALRRVLGGAPRAALLVRAWRIAETAGANSPGSDLGTSPKSSSLGSSLKASSSDEAEDQAHPTHIEIEALGRLIAAWKGAGLSPDQVARAAAALPSGRVRLAGRMRFLARAYAQYERLLGKAWTDHEGWQRGILARLRALQSLSTLGLGRTVDLVGLIRSVPVQRAVLERLRELGAAIRIRPALDLPKVFASEAGDGLAPFETLAQSFGSLRDALERGAADHGLADSGVELRPAAQLSPLAPLWKGGRTAPQVQRIEAPTPYAEVYEIGKRVRRWIEEEGLAPRTIAVAFRDLGPYSQYITDVFGRLNVPYYERRGEPAAFQPLVRAALAALDAVACGLEREPLFRFLCSGVVDVRALAGGAGEEDAHALHRLALDARIDRFFGPERNAPSATWKRRLDAYAESLGSAGRTERAVRLKSAGEVLFTAVRRLEELAEPRTRAKFSRAWRKLWVDAGLFAVPAPPQGYSHSRLSARVTEAQAALDAALDEAAAGPGAESERVTLKEYGELLELAIAEHSVVVGSEDRAGGVSILGLYDLRGLRFERLVLAGLAEGQFPVSPKPDPLLGLGSAHELRTALAGAAPELVPLAGLEPRLPAEVFDEERALLEVALRACRPAGRLLATRSRTSFDGREVSASSFWLEPALNTERVELAAPVRPAPRLAECLTGEEAELRIAWVLGGGADGGANGGAAAGTPDGAPPAAAEAALAVAAVGESSSGRFHEILLRASIERERALFFQELSRTAEERSGKAPGRVPERETLRSETGGPYGGFLPAGAPEAPAWLQRKYLAGAQELSPSALEAHARCGFKFLAQYVFQLDEAPEPADELAPTGQGGLWHEILAGFYRELLSEVRSAGRHVVVLEAEKRAACLERLQARARSVLDAAPRQHFTGHPGLWRLQRERIEAALPAWLDCELQAAGQEHPFRPAFVEFSFGQGAGADGPAVAVPISTAEGTGILRIAGRIDRFDLRVQDPLARKPLVTGVRLLDYKLGKASARKEQVKEAEVLSLRSAQLLLYLAAVLEHLRTQEQAGKWVVDWEAVPISARAAYYALGELPCAPGDGQDSHLVMLEDLELSAGARPGFEQIQVGEGKQDLAALLRQGLAPLLAAHFPVAPSACAGLHCAARFSCRYRDLPAEEDAGERGAGGGS